MAFTYGFYNSLRGDRKYDALQVSELFDGILADGVIPSQGQLFAVTTAGDSMQINVGTGRAWFFHTWSKNDSVMVLTVPNSDVTRPRIDAVVLEVDRRDDVRANSIKIVTGVPAVNAVKPTLLTTDQIHQYPLAYVTVPAAAEVIKAENIENMVGRSPTVFATGVLQTTPLDDLWAQWEGEWDTWFSAIKLQLSGDVVTNLQLQIDQLKTTDGIKITSAVSNKLGIPVTSSCSDALIYLDKQTKDLTNAIINSQNYTKTAEYTSPGTYTHKAKGTAAAVFIIGGGGGGAAGGWGKNDLTNDYAYGGGGGGGGGGGNGAYMVFKDGISVTKGTSYSIVVGKGGAGGVATNIGIGGYNGVNGTAGGTSSAFGYTANGGLGGSHGTNGAQSGTANGGGGSGSDSSVVYGGQGGYGGSKNQDSTFNGSSGGSGNSKSMGGYDTVYTVYSGAGGGGGGGSYGTTEYDVAYGTPGSGGRSSGGGNGGNGGVRRAEAGSGSSATTYGSGGGGGGGGSCAAVSTGSGMGVAGGKAGGGGSGSSGRVVILERGVFG